MDKTYDPHRVETQWYERWEREGHFIPCATGAARHGRRRQRRSRCRRALLHHDPAPNVTGTLHMGHAFQDTIMDALIRYHRMNGRRTLWQPGTDHAGIATQMVVERQINAEGLTRQDLGRDAFVERIWRWKEHSGSTITSQMRRMGASVDWTHERFTHGRGAVGGGAGDLRPPLRGGPDLPRQAPRQLGPGPADRGLRPGGGLRGRGRIPLAHSATRGPTARAAWRWRPHGRRRCSATPRWRSTLPTPATATSQAPWSSCRSPTGASRRRRRDGRSGVRHRMRQDHPGPRLQRLPGRRTPRAGAGQRPHLRRADERQCAGAATRGSTASRPGRRSSEDLEARGLLARTEPHRMTVPRGDRSQAVIEPWLTDQWFVKAGPLAEPSIRAVEAGHIRFVPDHWAKTFFEWMRNIEDWCISRQIWWGHRIPAWYDGDGNVYVGRSEEEVREKFALPSSLALEQDPDVLDTWYSSALWPFSTLGWPERTRPARDVLPDHRPRHRLRHHLLLGRPHDHVRAPVHGRRPVPRGVHPRAGARRRRQQDVEVEGQHPRPHRPDRRHRPRRAHRPSAPPA